MRWIHCFGFVASITLSCSSAVYGGTERQSSSSTLVPDQLTNAAYQITKSNDIRDPNEFEWHVSTWDPNGGWNTPDIVISQQRSPFGPGYFKIVSGMGSTYVIAMCESIVKSRGQIWKLGTNHQVIHTIKRFSESHFAIDSLGQLLIYAMDSTGLDPSTQFWHLETVSGLGLVSSAQLKIRLNDSTMSQYGQLTPWRVLPLRDGRWLNLCVLPEPHNWDGRSSSYEWLHYWITSPRSDVTTIAETVHISEAAFASAECPEIVAEALSGIDLLGSDSTYFEFLMLAGASFPAPGQKNNSGRRIYRVRFSEQGDLILPSIGEAKGELHSVDAVALPVRRFPVQTWGTDAKSYLIEVSHEGSFHVRLIDGKVSQ